MLGSIVLMFISHLSKVHEPLTRSKRNIKAQIIYHPSFWGLKSDFFDSKASTDVRPRISDRDICPRYFCGHIIRLKILLTSGLIEFKSNPSSIVTFYAPLDEVYTVNPRIIDRFIHSIAFSERKRK